MVAHPPGPSEKINFQNENQAEPWLLLKPKEMTNCWRDENGVEWKEKKKKSAQRNSHFTGSSRLASWDICIRCKVCW